PVRGPGEVVLDGLPDRVPAKPIPEPPEQGAQFVRGQQVKEHEYVGLLGDLEGVGRQTFGLEDPVETLNVAIATAVVLPVELGQVRVALELADDAVVKGDEDLACHLFPARALLLSQSQRLGQLY